MNCAIFQSRTGADVCTRVRGHWSPRHAWAVSLGAAVTEGAKRDRASARDNLPPRDGTGLAGNPQMLFDELAQRALQRLADTLVVAALDQCAISRTMSFAIRARCTFDCCSVE